MRRRVRVSRAPRLESPAGPAYPGAAEWGGLHEARNPRTRGQLALAEAQAGARADGWENATTGTGTARDKSMAMRYRASWMLRDEEITALYNSEDVAATIVDLPVDEMFRRGFKLEVKDGDASALLKAAEKVHLAENVKTAAKWGRAYGGGVCFIAWNDGQEPDMELRPETIDKARPIFYTKAFDRRYATVLERDNDPTSPQFGEALVFGVGIGEPVRVHRSRCVLFHGAKVDDRTRYELQGWTLSVLQRPYDALRQFNQSYASVGNLLTDASQGVFKMKNLIALLANKKTNDVLARLQFLDQARSTSRAIALDADGEDFTRVATPFAGLPEALEAFQKRLSAACRIPVTLLMGDSPAGLGATGASDIRFFYDSIANKQPEMAEKLLHGYRPLASALGLDPDAVSVTWPPLWEMTDQEKANTDLAIAQRDKVYVDAQVWTPEEVALSRAKGITATGETTIDAEYRATTLAQNIEFDTSHTPEEKAALVPPPKASLPGAVTNKGQVPGPKKPAGT